MLIYFVPGIVIIIIVFLNYKISKDRAESKKSITSDEIENK
jgi:hypothetical protein